MANSTGIVVREIPDSAVLVTGGTSGVGLATAVAFAKAGAKGIAIVGRDEERGRKARAHVLEQAPGANVHFVRANALDPAQAVSCAETVQKLFGRIDVLVNSTHNNVPGQPLHKIPIEDIAKIMTHVLAPYHMARAVLPGMQDQRGGVIVNLASDSAKTATPGGTVLGSCMAAIVMFSRTLAMEAKRNGIRVNALTPALITNTPLYDMSMADPFLTRVFDDARQRSPLGFATPEDLASLIVYLASPAAARLTGQTISINGGMSAV